jgi:stage IV sporulation protein B
LRKTIFNKKTILFLISILIIYTAICNKVLFHSSNLKIIKGENKKISISFPFYLEKDDRTDVVKTIFNEGSNGLKKQYNLNGVSPGRTNLELKLLGMFTIKNYDVNVVSRPELIPGGNTIGVRLNTKGVLVVAITDVIDINGNRVSPAKKAGLKIGDSIVKINDIKIKSAEEVVKILNDIKNEEVKLTILRNKNEFETTAIPVKCLQDNSYRLGIWVRDKTTGIGTLTYLDENNNGFGALGHGIIDVDTQSLLSVEDGLVIDAKVSDIELGKRGTPGEIKGVFYKSDEVLGKIKLNNEFGIYGKIEDDLILKNKNRTIPIAFKEEVEEGKAHILTTLDSNEIEEFEIEISKINSQNKADEKSMVIKVTDPKLLKKTGGIVQGMSGSPIIQNNRIIGAVTHVFVNDPTKGYGLYIEWMLEQSNRF